MNKLLTSMFALAVASVTAISAHAQEIKGDAKAAEQKIAMCIGCHGIKGYQASFPEVYRVPMISGQNAKYIVASLNAYKKGERKHPTMRGISASLSEQDMADLGAFYEQHAKVEPVTKTPKVPDAKVAALLQKGACISCHGDNFSKPIDPSYPKLAGQHKDFLFVALKSYKTENLSTWGRSNGVMGGIAKQFSNAELKAMAAYIGSLEGDMKVVPQSRLR
ncbi:c-type cytochrome [Limnohabitans sp.]|jgi:cytochrome c553|uniref:c-type cytochrome n=1 Tax=Limnohabitans sp. TaxID=1907725 RepID=UPI0037C12F26